MLRLVDVLTLPPVAAGAPRVLAGAGRLDAAVRWAHVFENREVAGAVEGDELLLTTGVSLVAMADTAIGQLVDELSTARVSGLALELGSVYAEAPDVLVAACARVGLPLIAFGRRVRFVEITQAVAELQLAAELARLRRSVGVQARLREAARDGHGAAALLAGLAEALDAELLVEQLDGAPILAAPADRGLSTRFLEALAARRAGRDSPLITQSVVIPGRRAARLHALVPDPTELEELTVSEGAFLLGAALAAEPRLDELLADDRARLVRSLADGRGTSATDARRRLRSVGVDVADTVTVFVARGVEGPAPALAEVHGRRARGLVAAGMPLPVAAATGLATASLEPHVLRQAFEDAERASLIAHALGRAVVWADRAAPFDPVAAAVLAGRRFGPALSARDERLLDALVGTGFGVAATARRLGVSRQSVYKELPRAERRLGVRPLDPGARAEISLRLIVHRMQGAVEADGAGW